MKRLARSSDELKHHCPARSYPSQFQQQTSSDYPASESRGIGLWSNGCQREGPDLLRVWCEKAAEVSESPRQGRCWPLFPSSLRELPDAPQFLVLTVAGWVNRHQEDLIDYLREENRVLREHLGRRPLRLTDAQRRRLAVRGKKLGRRVLRQVAGIVTPDTILRWYRRLIVQKYDGSARRSRGRPVTPREIADLVVRMAVENPQWG